MCINYVRIKDGKARIFWPAVIALIVAVNILVITLAEAFWFVLTGTWSSLMAGSSLVVSTLIVIRVVGAALTMPAYQLRGSMGSMPHHAAR